MGTRLIALDLDGTLLNEKIARCRKKQDRWMELCAQRGIEIVPATGARSRQCQRRF